MFSFIGKKIRYLGQRQINQNETDGNDSSNNELSKALKENLSDFNSVMGINSDVLIREFSFGEGNKINAALIFIDGLADTKTINESILKPLIENKSFILSGKSSIEHVKRTITYSADIFEINSISQVIDSCLSGYSVLIIDGFNHALSFGTKGWEKRSITEPRTENVVRGPREGFTEDFRTNTSLIRRKIKSQSLVMETMQIGRRTKTNVCLAYLKDVADPKIIKTIKSRLNNINTDAILETGYIEQYIEESPFSLFPTLGISEKPDVIAGKVLEGRAAIIVEGTPFVLTVPELFIDIFQVAEDYYLRPIYATMLRLLRFAAFFITIFAPSIYVALSTFHQEIIPTRLLFTMAEAREGIPFPAFIEALIMIISFEILREAGLRLPRNVGQAISIVGALVIGEAAVAAGFVGSIMVIVIAITAVAGFVIASQVDLAAILRLVFLVLSSFLGGYGIILGFLGVLVHLAYLKSFGVPYLGKFIDFEKNTIKDSFIKAPVWAMKNRPNLIAKNDIKRNDTDVLSQKQNGEDKFEK